MEEERLKEALRQIIREKGRTKKRKNTITKKATAIGSAVIISFTIAIQSDSIKKNQIARTNELLNIKKASNLTHAKIIRGIGENYTTEIELPHYLDEVYSTVAGPDLSEKTKRTPL